MLGEYPAFITVWAFVVDAILAGGAVARSWSSYLAQLVRQLSSGACCHVDSQRLHIWQGACNTKEAGPASWLCCCK